MKLYVVGHGFLLCRDPENKQTVRIPVPDGIALTFYCRPHAMFDSTWEKPIVDAGGQVGAHCPVDQARDDWAPETVLHECDEHLLTRPGKMRPYRKLAAMKRITPNAEGTQATIEPFQDGDTLYIDSEDHCLCRLSALLAALAGAGFSGTLHWLACRSDYPDYDSPQSRTFQWDVIEQACSEIDVIKQQPVLPPRQPAAAKGSMAKALDYAHDWPCDYPSIEDRGVT